MSRENDLTQVEIDRNLTEQQITSERGPDEIIAYPSQGVFVVPPEKMGPMKFPMGLSGSLTSLTDGTPYLIAGNNITITTGSKGQITISAVGKIGGVAGSSGGGGGVVATSVEWRNYTPVIGVITGEPPIVATEPFCYLSGKYVVQGKMMTLLFSMSGTGDGSSVGNGTYTISLPTGFSIDTNTVTIGTSGFSFLNGTSMGTASLLRNSSGAGGGWSVLANSATTLILVGQNTNSSISPIFWDSTTHPFNNNGTTYRISFIANIPLV